ncbi:hypothetical protein SAY86_014100 [Trapa natans]|uniref:Uncharacterized protein n=1 Tax=Trapa natans TaxID=22666 RepID=A0AAN7QR29_TRANT|nr:hypothetical protein SAY86_014100 [Trapa natans]
MELPEKMSLWSFFLEEEEEEEDGNLKNNVALSELSSSGANVFQNRSLSMLNPRQNALRQASSYHRSSAPTMPPMSPETPWMVSPVRSSSPPSQPLMYQCLASLHRLEDSILSLALSRSLIFTGTKSRRVHVWKQPSFAKCGRISTSSGVVSASLAHGEILFTAHGDCRVRAWGLTAKESLSFGQPRKIATLPQRSSFLMFRMKTPGQHKGRISCLAYNHDEKLLYTGSWDKTVKAWNITENRCEDSFVAHDGPINGLLINMEDGCVFTCASDGFVKIWRRVLGETCHILTMTLRFQLSPINALALSSSPGGCVLYSGSSDGLINFWEKEETPGRFSHGGFLQGHRFAVLCLSLVDDLVLSGSEDSTIRVWRREEMHNYLHSCLAVIEGHRGPVRCLAAVVEKESPAEGGDSCGGLLVYSAGSLDQTLKVWRVRVNPRGDDEHEKPERRRRSSEGPRQWRELRDESGAITFMGCQEA